MSLIYIGQQLTIYVGSFLVITGVIGNGINIWVFSSVRTYRQTPCTFYFLISSIFNIFYLCINLVSRIVMSGFEIDLTRTSVSWCKMRNFCLATLSLISFSFTCLATIDQFFATSQSNELRRLSNIKWSYRIVWIILFICCLHGIPYLFYFNISPLLERCINTNKAFAIYFPSVYILTLRCTVPVSVMIVFGYLTYRNIRLTRALAREQADRQLRRMILIETLVVCISSLQYGINAAYTLITSQISKDQTRMQIESFISTVSDLLIYLYYSGSCYMFLLTSSRFRRETKNRILFCRRKNDINPVQ